MEIFYTLIQVAINTYFRKAGRKVNASCILIILCNASRCMPRVKRACILELTGLFKLTFAPNFRFTVVKWFVGHLIAVVSGSSHLFC